MFGIDHHRPSLIKHGENDKHILHHRRSNNVATSTSILSFHKLSKHQNFSSRRKYQFFLYTMLSSNDIYILVEQGYKAILKRKDWDF